MVPRLNPQIQPLLDRLIKYEGELGLQVAAYLDGELVLDAWAGTAAPDLEAPINGETLFPVFSVTKGVASTAVHLLAERGQLNYETPITHYWPEFGVNGKESLKVRHALGHLAGLHIMPPDLDHRKLANWDYMTGAIAASSPTHSPGASQIYHAMTFGWIAGELVHRIDGRPFGQFLEEEIKAPLGITDLYCGIPEHLGNCITQLIDQNAETPANLGNGSVPEWIQPLYAWMNRRDAQRACIPASSGIMSARAIARHYAALLPGGIDGVELLPPTRIALVTQRQWPLDRENALKFGLGYALGGEGSIYGENPHAFGHGGYGGSIAFADPETRFAFALCKNKLNVGDTTKCIANACREALELA
ncbi:serine hydrolase domain-containing protein [Cerasicoccus frondis]|uniref:serine hydrolase domain-containing protein n=1 Tax=Cerasicoccus frondis TaxID=490090 RepID=UPI002852CEA8|nr:serine hydrolase domain-containing protein [Cerasicoccus frondis]